MEWMFWGWLKSLIQYSFYQVIAQAFVFVFGSFLLRAIDAFPPPYTVDKILVGGFHLIFLFIAFIYGMLKVPSLANSLFTGRSGESAMPEISVMSARRPVIPPAGYEFSDGPRRRYVEQYASSLVLNNYLKIGARQRVRGDCGAWCT